MATELIGIELELRGEEGVFRDLQKLDNMLKGFGGARGKKAIELDLGQSKQRLIELRGAMNQTRESITKLEQKARMLNRLRLSATNLKAEGRYRASLEQTNRKLSNQKKYLSELKTEYKDVTLRVNELNYALKNLSQMSWGQMFKGISTSLRHIGQNAQTLGHTLTRLGTPMQSITSGLLMGVGYKALGMITEGFSGAFERADIMDTYDRSLKALGLDVDKTFSVAGKSAMTAKENLDEAVQGLPTSLDEIMDAQKVYAGATGEMVSSTKTAIAANNTFLASAMDARNQRFMQRYLVALASGADLTKTQWQSMARIAPLAMRAVSKELGYADEDYKQFTADVQSGKIAGEDFLKAFQKVGTSGSVARAARVTAMTWSGLASNVSIAFKRMGQGIIKTLNEVVKNKTGMTLLQQLLGMDDKGNYTGGGIRGFINNMSESVQEWIKANPDKLFEFFDTIKNLDFKGFGEGMLNGAKLIYNAMKLLGDAFGGKSMRWLGWFLTMAGPAGRAISLFGGLLKGLSIPLGAILATIAKLAMMFKGEIGKKGIFEALGRFFGRKKGIADAEEVMAEIPTFSNTLRRSLKSLEGIITAAGAILTVSGTAFVAFKAVKSVLKDLGEIMDIAGGINWNKGIAAFTIIGSGIGGLAWVFNKLGTVLGKDGLLATAIAGLATIIVSGSVAADMRLLKDGLKSFSEMLDMIAEIPGKLKAIKKIRKGDKLLDNLTNVVDTLNSVSDVLNGEDIGRGEKTGGLKRFKGKHLRNIKRITKFAEALNGIVDDLNKLNSTKLNVENFPTIKVRMGKAFTELGELMDTIPNRFKTAWGDKDFGFIESSMGHVTGIFASIKTLMAKMREAFDLLDPKNTNELFGNNVAWNSKNRTAADSPISKRLKPLFDQIKEIQGMMTQSDVTDATATSFAKKMQNFARGFRSMVKVFTRLQQIELFSKRVRASANGYGIPGMNAVRGLLTQLEGAFRADRMDSINSQINDFIEQINSLIDTISKISVDTGNLNIEIHISNHIFGLEETLLQIRNINTQVRQAINGIQTYYKKTITVDISTSGMRMYDSSITGGNHQQMGGLIYRAGGGSVFKPRGTDTVPAMLTPGEFVQRKQAVDFFGADFMRKVNNLDVRGAMHDLLTRAGSMTQNTRQSIVNNTVNNNQRVNMTVNSDNPETIKIRMSRFAGAF